jgi:RecB family exonuclease
VDPQLSDHERDMLRLTDQALVDRLYDTVSDVVAPLNHAASDELYWLVRELVERWRPELELANWADRLDDDEQTELFEVVEGMTRRWRARVAQRTFPKDDGA